MGADEGCGHQVRSMGADGRCGKGVRTEGAARGCGSRCGRRVLLKWTADAIRNSVGVRHFSELVAWQLSEALRVEVMAVAARADDARDYRFRDQLRASALSAPANIAEGFGRYAHRDFARFCDIAVGSLTETESHLKVARRHGYVGVEDYKALLFLIRRARTATIRLKAYLRRTLTPD